jgi:hypothetical protein
MSLTLSPPMSAPIKFSLFFWGIRQQHQRDIQLHDEIIGQLNFWARSLNTCPKSCQRSVSIRQHAYLSVRRRRGVGSYGPRLAGCSEVCGRTVRLFCFCSRTKTAQCDIHLPYWQMHSRLPNRGVQERGNWKRASQRRKMSSNINWEGLHNTCHEALKEIASGGGRKPGRLG